MPELVVVPTLEELDLTIGSLSCGKSPGLDGIPAEVLRANIATLLPSLHRLVVRCWEDGDVPQDMKEAMVYTLYKNKGDKGSCDNYRGILLLSVPGKAVAKAVLRRLLILGERVFPETQCGFKAGRSTINMIITLPRQLQEKCLEQRQPLYIAFVDMLKHLILCVDLPYTVCLRALAVLQSF